MKMLKTDMVAIAKDKAGDQLLGCCTGVKRVDHIICVYLMIDKIKTVYEDSADVQQ